MRSTTFLSLIAASCGWNPAFDEPAATSASGTGTSQAPIDPPTSTAGAPDPSTTTGSVLVPTTDETTTSTTSTTTSTDTTDATTGAAKPTEEETLRFYEDGHCGVPLWCHHQDNEPSIGEPQRTASQLCFKPVNLPPYRLTRVGYQIADTFGNLDGSSFLEVFTRGPDGGPDPDAMLLSLPMSGGNLVPGAHALVFKDPPVIAAREFCVGLVGGYTDGDGAGLGVGVDPDKVTGKRSWLNFSDGGVCELPGWNDLDVVMPVPNGTWCIDVTVLGNPP